MAKPLVSDELWDLLRPLLPPPKPRRFRYPGRKRLDDRKALTGIPFVLKTGIPWEDLPAEMGCGCGMTCWRRLHDWQPGRRLVPTPSGPSWRNSTTPATIDWARAAVDGTFARAFGGVEGSGRNPTDRGRPGIKRHVACRWPRHPLGGRPYPGQQRRRSRSCCPWWTAPGRLDGQRGEPEHRPEKVYGGPGVQLGTTPRGVTGNEAIEPKLAKRRDGPRQWPGEVSLGGGAVLLVGHGFRKLRFVTEKAPGDAVRLLQPRPSLSFVFRFL